MKKKWLTRTFIGLGVLIPIIAFAADTRIQTNQTIFGQKNTGNVDKTLQFDIGAGSSANPKIKWQASSNSFAFANDGSTFRLFGSGSGGGSGGINLLAANNGDFESGTSSWTASGGSFTTVSASPNLIDGLKTGSWTPSAGSQTLASTLQSVVSVAGLQGANCSATALYKTAEGTNQYSWEVLDNSSNVLAGPVTLTQTSGLGTGAQAAPPLTFICPSSGSIQVKFIAAASTPSNPLYVDDVTLGSNVLNNISQAQFYGSVTTPTTGSCAWSVTSATLSAFPANASCPVATAEGNASAPATKIPAIRFPNGLPAGRFLVTASSDFYTGTSGFCNWVISDGTTNFALSAQSSNANTQSGSNLIGGITYNTVQPATQFQIKAANAFPDTCNIDASSQNNTFKMEVYYFPTTTQVAVKTDQVGWKVGATFNSGSANVGLSGGNVTTPTVVPGESTMTLIQDSGSLPVQVPCSGTNPSTGTTCSSGNPQLGAVFNAPVAGPVLMCLQFTHHVGSAANTQQATSFQLNETSNTSDSTILTSGVSVVADTHNTAAGATGDEAKPFTLCDVFNLTTAGQHTFRLFYKQGAPGAGTLNSNQIMIGTNTPGNSQMTSVAPHLTVIPIGQSIQQPVILNSVKTSNPGQMRIESAIVTCSNSGSTTITNPGSWIASMTDGSNGGECSLNLSTAFSAVPACTCVPTANAATTGVSCYMVATGNSSSVVHIQNLISGAATNTNSHVICVGPK